MLPSVAAPAARARCRRRLPSCEQAQQQPLRPRPVLRRTRRPALPPSAAAPAAAAPSWLRAEPSSRATTSAAAKAAQGAAAAAAAAAAGPSAPASFTIRRATASDLEAARRVVIAERINPLGLDASRTLAAVSQQDGGGGGAWLGSGQLSPLQRAPWQRQPSPSSSPPSPLTFELRSLVVAPGARGRGVGSALVRALLGMASEEAAAAKAAAAWVYLTTTASSAAFYEREGGFERVALSEAPPLLQAEVAVGTFVAAVVARERLVVMARRV